MHHDHTSAPSRGTGYLMLGAFLVLVVGGGLLIGATNMPGEWYAQLQKPAFTPPGWLFGPVWTLLYVLIAMAGWRIWRGGDGALKGLWAGQMTLNFAWSPVFFSAHVMGLALVVILALVGTILAVIVRSWHRDRLVAWLFLPYALWVGFASVLNAALWWIN